MSLTSYRAAPSRDAFGCATGYRLFEHILDCASGDGLEHGVGRVACPFVPFGSLPFWHALQGWGIIVVERYGVWVLLGLAVTYSPTS